MMIPFLISKIHRATITGTSIDYNGSISIDTELMLKGGLKEFQKVEIYNITNGNRFSTYVIPAEKGSKEIIINGAAAHKVALGDKIIIASYGYLNETEMKELNPLIVLLKDVNVVDEILNEKF